MAHRYKVLIVDDAEINRALLSDMLSEEYDILEAANGLEAVAQLNRLHSEISLVLLDIIMPKMDGFQVLASMHKNGFLDTIPVIIISGETSPAYIDHAYDLGATEYVSRPFDAKTVKRRVRNTIMLYSKQKLLEAVTCYKSEELVQVASDICRWHHERYDGGGYPDGLKGEEIPIAAQVVALADVYDALTNERVYKPAYSHSEALRMILDGECGAFNPLLFGMLKERGPLSGKRIENPFRGSNLQG